MLYTKSQKDSQFVDPVLGLGSIPNYKKNYRQGAMRILPQRLRLCRSPAAAAPKAPGFAGPQPALRPAGNSFCDWVYTQS
jgi:hypothetical protein